MKLKNEEVKVKPTLPESLMLVQSHAYFMLLESSNTKGTVINTIIIHSVNHSTH